MIWLIAINLVITSFDSERLVLIIYGVLSDLIYFLVDLMDFMSVKQDLLIIVELPIG